MGELDKKYCLARKCHAIYRFVPFIHIVLREMYILHDVVKNKFLHSLSFVIGTVSPRNVTLTFRAQYSRRKKSQVCAFHLRPRETTIFSRS